MEKDFVQDLSMSSFTHVYGVYTWFIDVTLLFVQDAFEKGSWGRMNARDRGTLMYRYGERP